MQLSLMRGDTGRRARLRVKTMREPRCAGAGENAVGKHKTEQWEGGAITTTRCLCLAPEDFSQQPSKRCKAPNGPEGLRGRPAAARPHKVEQRSVRKRSRLIRSHGAKVWNRERDPAVRPEQSFTRGKRQFHVS